MSTITHHHNISLLCCQKYSPSLFCASWQPWPHLHGFVTSSTSPSLPFHPQTLRSVFCPRFFKYPLLWRAIVKTLAVLNTDACSIGSCIQRRGNLAVHLTLCYVMAASFSLPAEQEARGWISPVTSTLQRERIWNDVTLSRVAFSGHRLLLDSSSQGNSLWSVMLLLHVTLYLIFSYSVLQLLNPLFIHFFGKEDSLCIFVFFFFSMSRGRCPLSCACDPVPSWPCDVFSPDLKMGKYTKDTWHYWLLKVCVFVCRMGVWFRCQAYDTSPYPLTQNPEIISMYPFDTLLSKVT